MTTKNEIETLWHTAIAAHQQGKWTDAQTHYQEILKIDKNFVPALNALAGLLAQQGEYERSLTLLNHAISVDKSSPSLYSSRGNVFRRQSEWDLAQDDYMQALRLKPDYCIALNNLALCYRQQEKWDKAIETYQKAISIEPEQPTWHLNCALTYLAQHEANTNQSHDDKQEDKTEDKEKDNECIEKAEKELKAALEINAEFHPAQFQLAELYMQSKRYAEALPLYQKYTKSFPNHIDALLSFMQCQIENKRYEQAIKNGEHILELDSKQPDINYLLATAHMHKGETAKADQYYRQQIEENPNLESYYNVGVILSLKNRYQEAIHYFLEALIYNPDYVDAHLNLASIYMKRQEYEKARNHYYKVESLQPDNQEVKHLLAALTGEKVPDRAPDTYVENLFGHYAPHYDEHLVKHLKFSVPDIIAKAVDNYIGPEPKSLRILDLGCGTGLCAEKLEDSIKEIDGVDLSADMLLGAEHKNIYNNLSKSDITSACNEVDDPYDLIIAGDVLPYVGKLDDIFTAAQHALKPGGHFIFTVERGTKQDVELQTSARYRHKQSYIESEAKSSGFKWSACDNVVLREQMKKPIEGYCVVLQKK